jgi:hypothetical protein
MRPCRFNIGSLAGFVLLCGVAFAALKESTDLWESGVFSITTLVLLTSVLLAIHRTGARRHFWVGFALFGGCYLALALIPPIEARLISTKALAFLHSKLPGQQSASASGVFVGGWESAALQPPPAAFSPQGGNQVAVVGQQQQRLWVTTTSKLLTVWGNSTENFVRIGHCWLGLCLAWLGGILSRRLSRTSTASDAGAAVGVDIHLTA